MTQLTSLSVSLAQFLANGQQLPQLYAARSLHNGTFANSEDSVKPDSVVTIQPNQAVEPQKQYDPICDSVEHSKLHANSNPPDQKLEILSKNLSTSSLSAGPNSGDFNKFRPEQDFVDKSSQLKQPGPGVSSEANKENNGVGSEESNKVQEQDKSAPENGPLENSDGDGKADESKKNKDGKGNRAFKFALVEFVKDLLRPAWREGQVSKDAYKNIVKKVVDKVTGTMQSASVPTTQEKIEQYLSVSKPKLTKLVQVSDCVRFHVVFDFERDVNLITRSELLSYLNSPSASQTLWCKFMMRVGRKAVSFYYFFHCLRDFVIVFIYSPMLQAYVEKFQKDK